MFGALWQVCRINSTRVLYLLLIYWFPALPFQSLYWSFLLAENTLPSFICMAHVSLLSIQAEMASPLTGLLTFLCSDAAAECILNDEWKAPSVSPGHLPASPALIFFLALNVCKYVFGLLVCFLQLELVCDSLRVLFYLVVSALNNAAYTVSTQTSVEGKCYLGKLCGHSRLVMIWYGLMNSCTPVNDLCLFKCNI